MKQKIRDIVWHVRFWWSNRWFRRNHIALRNVAAWAVHHNVNGGSHDANAILDGCADRRIQRAAAGEIGGESLAASAIRRAS